MAKVKVTTKFRILEFIDHFVDNATASAIGNTVVDTAKQMISEGQSPVRGFGRFIGYAESYKKAIKGKSDKYADKKVRPVNLFLSGRMMAAYKFNIRGASVFVGVMGGGRNAEIAGYHQDGTNKMPARPLVPGDNEEWAVTIMRAIRDVYGARLEKLIRQANKKE